MAVTAQDFHAISRQQQQAEPAGSPVIVLLLMLLSWGLAIGVGIAVSGVAGVLCSLATLFGIPTAWVAFECARQRS